jgi:ribonuclease VapC
LIAVDTLALVAIVFDEAERDSFLAVLTQADTAWISTVSVLEARRLTYGRRGPRAVVMPGDLLRLPPFVAASPDRNELDAAYGAFLAFGKGSGHRAALNFGDVSAAPWPRSTTCPCSTRAMTSATPTFALRRRDGWRLASGVYPALGAA